MRGGGVQERTGGKPRQGAGRGLHACMYAVPLAHSALFFAVLTVRGPQRWPDPPSSQVIITTIIIAGQSWTRHHLQVVVIDCFHVRKEAVELPVEAHVHVEGLGRNHARLTHHLK